MVGFDFAISVSIANRWRFCLIQNGTEFSGQLFTVLVMETMSMIHPLRQYRKANKLTLDQVGRRLGVTGATVSRWEMHVRNPGHDDLKKIEQEFGIPIAEIVNAVPASEAAQ